MRQQEDRGTAATRASECWMRSVSFGGLHRMLSAVAESPRRGLRAGEIVDWVRENEIALSGHTAKPAPTTIYHYRNTLVRLGALRRDGVVLRPNEKDPAVSVLLRQPAPVDEQGALTEPARRAFAVLVLKNEQCRSLFFDFFMPCALRGDVVSEFRETAVPVTWSRQSGSREVVFRNETTGGVVRRRSAVSIAATLYGLRYWARDELGLVDEYWRAVGDRAVIFPVLGLEGSAEEAGCAVERTVQSLLSLRGAREWTLMAVSDLIERCCEKRRQPLSILFSAIDWLLDRWPHHTVLVPTSRSMATAGATSASRDRLVLRGYYKAANGPYVSHIRLHEDIIAPAAAQ